MHHRAPYREIFNSSMGGLRSALAKAALILASSALLGHIWSSELSTVTFAQTPAVDSPAALLRQASDSLRADKLADASRLALKASMGSEQDPVVQQRSAELLFLSGSVEESLPCFERANKLDEKLAPHNWQRGVALGCAGQWKLGADQFRQHHEVNPDDVENSAWYFLCVAKTEGAAAARAALIPSRGDRRQPMMSVLKMLQGTLAPEEVLAAAEANTEEGAGRKLAMFYGFLYVGLYYDSIGEIEKAKSAMDRSVELADPDYMGRTARIYRDHRFATSPDGSSLKPPVPDK